MASDWVRISDSLTVNLRHVAAVSRQPGKVTVYFPGPVGPNLSTYSAVEPQYADGLMVAVGLKPTNPQPQKLAEIQRTKRGT